MLKDITKEFTLPKEVVIDFNGFKFYKKSLTCVYGLLGVGKSSLLLKFVDIAINNKVKTIFIDSEKKMCSVGNSILQRRINLNEEGYNKYFEIAELKSVEELFESEIKLKEYDLIILDSASHLLPKIVGWGKNKVADELMRYLRKLVVEYNKTIIFSAQAYTKGTEESEQEKIRNYGGIPFRSQTDEAILIKRYKKDRRTIKFERAVIGMKFDIIDGDILNIDGGIKNE